MVDKPRETHKTHRRVCLAGFIAAAGSVAVVLLSGGPGGIAGATPELTYAAYPALENTESTGLPIVSPGTPAATTLGAEGPTFPANPSGGLAAHGPVAKSIRRLPVSLPGISAWIAKSAAGGICVLASRKEPTGNGAYGLGMSCAPSAMLASGTMLELQSDSNGDAVVGVVPDDVSAVRVVLAGGASTTIPVAGNAWALEAEAHVESTQNVMGG